MDNQQPPNPPTGDPPIELTEVGRFTIHVYEDGPAAKAFYTWFMTVFFPAHESLANDFDLETEDGYFRIVQHNPLMPAEALLSMWLEYEGVQPDPPLTGLPGKIIPLRSPK